jgi:hypothetical protein
MKGIAQPGGVSDGRVLLAQSITNLMGLRLICGSDQRLFCIASEYQAQMIVRAVLLGRY